MSFDYDRIKSKEESGSHWATYSDLFMVLSLVFLLLYVTASLRSGTSNLQNHTKFKQLVRERDELKERINYYANQTDDFLTSDATASQQKQYEDLMKKMELLQDEAKQKNKELAQAAKDQRQKARELNKFQKIVKDLYTANVVSTLGITRRDNTIEKNYEEIDQQQEEIKDLEKSVASKQNQIKRDEKKIQKLNNDIERKIAALKNQRRKNKISKKKMRAQIKKIREQKQNEITKLELANAKAKRDIRAKQQRIVEVNQQLSQAERTISAQQSDIQALQNEKAQTSQKIAQMRNNFQEQMRQEQAEFDAKLAQQKLSAKAKAAKQREFLKQAQAKEAKLANQIQNMESQVQNVQGQLDKSQQAQAKAEKQARALAAKNKNLKGQQQKLSADLQKAKELAAAKSNLIKQIKKNLSKAGLKAQVGKNGDVVIQFGDEYFDTGKATIKPGMEKVLKKFMPAYSQSLLSNPKTAEKIKSIEIVGFASPTFRGKYVNPVSLAAGNKKARNYNLDLSYYRARSIFDYIFDTNKMQYTHQKEILPMVKVTGKSFFAEGANKRDISSMSHKEYCKKFDCKKSQRVVIKFNMEN